MADVRCPYCSTNCFSLSDLSESLIIRTKCVKVECGHRFTVTVRNDPTIKGGRLYPVSFVTDANRRIDKVDPVELGNLKLVELRRYVYDRQDAIVAYSDYLDCTLDAAKRMLGRKEREQKDLLRQTLRVEHEQEAAKAASLAPVRKKATPDDTINDVMRTQLRRFIGIRVKQGKLTAEHAEQLLIRLHTKQGMAEAAKACGMQSMLED